MRRALFALAFGLASVAGVVASSPAQAAPYCPNPFSCSTGFAGWQRWITCGSWQYNPYIGLRCDRCWNCIV